MGYHGQAYSWASWSPEGEVNIQNQISYPFHHSFSGSLCFSSLHHALSKAITLGNSCAVFFANDVTLLLWFAMIRPQACIFMSSQMPTHS